MKKIENETLKDLNQIFTSNIIDIDEKKNLINLKKIYLHNLGLKNISEIENELYNNKTQEEKISFEMNRIRLKLFHLEKKESDVVIRLLSYLEKILKNSNKFDTKKYDKLFKSIIKIELELGMDIGLFEEFNLYFEDEVKRYMEIIYNYEIENVIENENNVKIKK